MEPIKTLRITCVSIVAISFIQTFNVLDFSILHFVNKRIVNKLLEIVYIFFVVLVWLELSGVKGLRLPPLDNVNGTLNVAHLEYQGVSCIT